MPPITATITEWTALDGVGRLTLEHGELIRFGASACPFPPHVGLTVQVLGLAPHPLGGQRATAIALPPDADALFDAAAPAPGLLETPAFIEVTDGVGLLGLVLREPPTTRAQLRGWFERFGASVDFSNPRALVVRLEGAPYRVYRVVGELAGGRGVFSFALHGPFSLQQERALALAGVALGQASRVEALAGLQGLARFVAACAPTEVAVIAHQAPGFLATAEAWLSRQLREPLDAWVWQTRSPGGDLVMTGFRALQLPDLFTSTGTSAQLHAAGRALVTLGRTPAPGEALGPLTVRSSDHEWVGLTAP
jgi:hypothetical protein